MRKVLSLLVALALTTCWIPASYADDPSANDLAKMNKELMNEVADLRNQVKDLSSRVSAAERRPASGAPTYVPSPGAPAEGGVLRVMEDINISGYLDTSYDYNFNRPIKAGTSAGTNRMRVFDTRDNNFNLNALEFDFEKLAPAEGGVGFRADLMYGLNAFVTDGAGLNFAQAGAGANDEFDLQQAYIDVNVPLTAANVLGDKVNIKAGKMVTLAGAEVIEAKDNWNISRSYSFGFSIPFTHTGVRTEWNLGDVKTIIGLNNGWDQVQDTNSAKTVEFAMYFNPTETLTFATANYLGPESAADANTAAVIDDVRFITSNILTWKTPVENLTLMGSFEFGNQRNVPAITAGAPQPEAFDSGQWHAYNLYAKYDLNDKTYVALREELFMDDDYARTFGTTTPSAARRYWGHTLTLDHRPYKNLITRLEARLDTADTALFDVPAAGVSSNSSQTTLASELIYTF